MQLMVKSEWVKFVAIQHRSATLIYDLITMKGTGESYFKKYDSHSKQHSSKTENHTYSSKRLKK